LTAALRQCGEPRGIEMSHDKGIEAAIKEGEDIDWVSCLLGTGIGSCQQLFEAQIQAYLSASNQVLVPIGPTPEMRLAAITSPLPSLEDNRPLYEICWGRMLSAYPNPFKDK